MSLLPKVISFLFFLTSKMLHDLIREKEHLLRKLQCVGATSTVATDTAIVFPAHLWNYAANEAVTVFFCDAVFAFLFAIVYL
jgi:hypothetical protein